MPPELEGLRRLPGHEKFVLVIAYFVVIRQWLLRQPLYRRIMLGAALYLLVALTAYAVFGSNACAVVIDGRVVAVAADEKSARGTLGELIELKSAQAGIPVVAGEKVAYRGVRAEPGERLEGEALKEKLSQTVAFKARAAVIMINGEPKVFLKQVEDAEKVLDWLKALYPVQDGDQLEFKEKVEIGTAYAAVESILDLETAKKMVLLGSNKAQQYTVKEGDTLWDIARAIKYDMDQIILKNPGLDPDNLSVGQVLDLSREAPLITVVATRQVTVEEEIPYPVEVKNDDSLLPGERLVIRKGEPGERIVTYRIVRENGLETGREILEQKVLREASAEVVARSPVSIVAARGGSIRLNWPASGGVASPFGMRWGRMHEGVDIGAGYGSAVEAAAGGIVASAGWEGGYGNTVEINHGGGIVTRYAHLSSIKVRSGQRVDRGELIGLVGATGNTTGPHLHFEVLISGQPRDPLDYLP